MDVFEAVKNRRSVRAFTDQPVSDEEVEKLIDAARSAPSAGNIQPWGFIVVRDRKIKRGLCRAALDQTFIEKAPVIVVVCADPERSGRRYRSRGINLYCLQDTAAATQNMLLTAQAMGLATCWVGAFREEEAMKVLEIPEGVRPVAIVPIGHAAEKPRVPPRRSLNEIVHRETYRQK